MKLLCWNIRGFGNLGWRHQLIDYIRQEEIDIVGLQETIRQDFSIQELQGLSRRPFAWQWLPATGISGGILLGVREDLFSVEDMDRGELFLNMAVTDRRVNLIWEVIIVYGPANHGWSADILAELKDKVEHYTTPVVVAGDFNLIRQDADKSSPNVDRLCMCMFNDYIEDLALREIARVGARFTWTNKQVDPIRSVLDRVLVTVQWEIMLPLCSLRAVTRIGSNHVPLLFASGDGSLLRTRHFHFESSCLLQPGFFEMVWDRWWYQTGGSKRWPIHRGPFVLQISGTIARKSPIGSCGDGVPTWVPTSAHI
jgi:exonuclease III